jgi:MmyB-like transcription regulator ligand binding domain
MSARFLRSGFPSDRAQPGLQSHQARCSARSAERSDSSEGCSLKNVNIWASCASKAAAGQRPDDPQFATLAAELTEASPEFREWWAEYPIRDFRPATIRIDHPEIGRLDLEMFQFRPVEHPDMLMVLQVPRSMDDLRRVTSLLDAPDRRR